MTGEDALLTANFQKDNPEIYTLDIVIEPAEGGQVIVKADDEVQNAPYSFAEGTEVLLEAIAEENFTFMGWQINDETPINNPITLTMESNFSVTANFDFESGISEDILSDEPTVFPNPASQNITLQSPYLIKNLEIHDPGGMLVLAQEINTDLSIINISGLNSGIYIVKIYVEESYFDKIFKIVR
jgi:hypothetical protein